MVQRLTYRRRLSYNTRSNRTRVCVSRVGICLEYACAERRSGSRQAFSHLSSLSPLFFSFCSVKTPGGKLTYLYTKRKAAGPKCGDCGLVLQAIPALRPKKVSSRAEEQAGERKKKWQ